MTPYNRRLWKARIRLFLRYWLVDTFGWVAGWAPMMLVAVLVWAQVTGIHLTRPAEPSHEPTMSDVGGPGFLTAEEALELGR